MAHFSDRLTSLGGKGWATCLRIGLAFGLAWTSLCLVSPRQALAYVACRSDPILVVNGSAVDIVSMLDTYPSAVRELDYTITVPAGSLLAGTTLTVGLGFPERVAYIHSLTQPWGTLRIAATVQTQPGVAPFTTTMQATSLLATGAASGQSDSTLTMTLGAQIMI